MKQFALLLSLFFRVDHWKSSAGVEITPKNLTWHLTTIVNLSITWWSSFEQSFPTEKMTPFFNSSTFRARLTSKFDCQEKRNCILARNAHGETFSNCLLDCCNLPPNLAFVMNSATCSRKTMLCHSEKRQRWKCLSLCKGWRKFQLPEKDKKAKCHDFCTWKTMSVATARQIELLDWSSIV